MVTTLITVVRTYVRVSKQKRLHADDYALFGAVAFYFALAALYIVDIPYLYAFLDYTSGNAPFTPDLTEKYAYMMRINYAVTPLFWAVLWSVKMSLLLFFKRVIRGTIWMRVWWVIFGITVLSFVGCVVSEFTSCDSIKDFTVFGE